MTSNGSNSSNATPRRIDSGEPTIKIRGALVHMHCAVQRRRVARR
jgi:hypothetical protein